MAINANDIDKFKKEAIILWKKYKTKKGWHHYKDCPNKLKRGTRCFWNKTNRWDGYCYLLNRITYDENKYYKICDSCDKFQARPCSYCFEDQKWEGEKELVDKHIPKDEFNACLAEILNQLR